MTLGDLLLGTFLAVMASLGWGSSAIFTRLALLHMRSTTGTILSLWVGLALFMTLAFVFHREAILRLRPDILGWMALSGVLNFPMGRFFNYTAVQRLGVSRATPIIGSAPLFATLYAVVFTGERVTPLLLVGTVSIVAGIALLVSAPHGDRR